MDTICKIEQAIYEEIIKQADIQAKRRANGVIIIMALIIATLVTGFATWHLQLNAEAKAQNQLAQEVLRFHILANSDSEADQTLKMQVKQRVLTYLEQDMPEGMNAKETKVWMRSHTDELEQVGRDTIADYGADYSVNAAVTTSYFPDKTYGDEMFPAGNYEALRIEIGAAKGHNWWCVLYPGISFTDSTNAVIPEEGKEKLKNVLTEAEYSKITAQSDFEIKSFFAEKLLKK